DVAGRRQRHGRRRRLRAGPGLRRHPAGGRPLLGRVAARGAAAGRAPGHRRAESSDRPAGGRGVELTPLERSVDGAVIRYPNLEIRLDREQGAAWFTLSGPPAGSSLPSTPEAIAAAGAAFWPLALCRELDDAILHLRFNEPEIGTWVLQTEGDVAAVLAADDVLREHAADWLVREIRLYWRRTPKPLALSARTLVTLVSPGSCFAGTLAELVLAA